MAKSTRMDKGEIQKITPRGGGLLKYAEQDNSMSGMEGYVIVPRLKIIQAMTKGELKDKVGGEGACCIRPGDLVVAKKVSSKEGEEFAFVPQFFFNQWAKWKDRNDNSGTNFILESSYDPASELAKRSANKDLRYEVYPDQGSKPADKQLKYSYVHHFCWAGVIFGQHELAGTSVVLSMERGEWGNGRQFITAIGMRRETVQEEGQEPAKVKVPLWAQVWGLKPKLREQPGKAWWGFDFFAPSETVCPSGPTLPDELMDEFHEEHLRLAKLHEENRLRVDHAEGDDTSAEGSAPAPQDSQKF